MYLRTLRIYLCSLSLRDDPPIIMGTEGSGKWHAISGAECFGFWELKTLSPKMWDWQWFPLNGDEINASTVKVVSSVGVFLGIYSNYWLVNSLSVIIPIDCIFITSWKTWIFASLFSIFVAPSLRHYLFTPTTVPRAKLIQDFFDSAPWLEECRAKWCAINMTWMWVG